MAYGGLYRLFLSGFPSGDFPAGLPGCGFGLGLAFFGIGIMSAADFGHGVLQSGIWDEPDTSAVPAGSGGWLYSARYVTGSGKGRDIGELVAIL
jgi:hypothetical protein